MALYRIADLLMEIEVRDERTKAAFADYLVNEDATPDCTITVTREDMMAEMEKVGAELFWCCEATVVLRKVCVELLYRFNGIFLHAATILYRGKAYAFVAPSGTGKSTHIALWQKVLGDEVRVLNGDKLLIRSVDGKFIAYGSPWQGKENWGENAAAPLGGIYMLRRGDRDRVESLPDDEAIKGLLASTVVPSDTVGKLLVIDMLDTFIKTVDMCALYCTMEDAAVEAARAWADNEARA